jgi:hypothetical protein
MNGHLSEFIKRILFFSLTLLTVSAVLFIFLLESYFLPVYILLFVINLFITITTYRAITKNADNKSTKFTRNFISATGIKFLVYLIIYTTYVFLYKENAIPFTIAFFTLYLSFSIFEITEILKFFKNK